jgi:hypothetical protein
MPLWASPAITGVDSKPQNAWYLSTVHEKPNALGTAPLREAKAQTAWSGRPA